MKKTLFFAFFLLFSAFPFSSLVTDAFGADYYQACPETRCIEDPKADFFKAVKQSDRASVLRLLSKNPKLVLATDEHSMTPFLLAVHRKNREMANLLAQKSSRLTARGDKGNAFHIAAANQDEPMIKLLTKLTQAKDAGLTRKMLNYQRNIYMPASYSSNDGNSPLHIAAQKCNRRIYNYYVSLGADESVQNSLKKTPREIMVNCEKTRRQIQKQKEAAAARQKAAARIPKDDGI